MAIGIVNSSRIAAGFLGAVYLVLAGTGLLVVPLLAGLSGPGGFPKEARL